MTLSVAIAVAVHARPGDIVQIFWLRGAPELRGEKGSWRSVFSQQMRAANSPMLYNETARTWHITEYQAPHSDSRAPGEARSYPLTPDPQLPVTRLVRGTVIQTLIAHDTTDGHHDTMVTVEVIEDRVPSAGESWLPSL